MAIAPFPYIGGKRLVAEEVWARLGDVTNYIEPFCGSCAVLLARPHVPRLETVNDADCLLANFWRAMKYAPEALARECDWPVNEGDLHARHAWLVRNRDGLRQLIMSGPKAFDLEAAAWWCWGISQWIGGGWCADRENVWKQRPHMTGKGNGVHATKRQKPYLTFHGRGVHQKKPLLTSNGTGVHRKRPALTGNSGKGVHGGDRFDSLHEWFESLSARLRRVRVVSGDWKRAVTPAVLNGSGHPVGIFLDPPYAHSTGRSRRLYACEGDVTHEVLAWAIANGSNPRVRIALCGYEGEHDMPEDWDVYSWSTTGGYGHLGKSGRGINNGKKERIWFSPHCLKPELDMFEGGREPS